MSLMHNLRILRERAGYSNAKDFAKQIDVKYSSYLGYETKGVWPNEETLVKIADALHVTTDELLGHTVRDSFEYCKNLIESFEFEWMTVEENTDGTICISDYRGELCRFQSREEFVNHVLGFEKSFLDDNNYKLYFNLHIYNSMTQLSENQQRHNDTLQYIKESLDEITADICADTKKQLQEILTSALDTIKTQDTERSPEHE